MSDKLIISGSRPLEGEVSISGAKNAVLKLMAAALLASDVSKIHNVPELTDVEIMLDVLECLGAKCNYDKTNKFVEIDAKNLTSVVASDKFVSKMRASFVVLGALVGRMKEAKVALPGGCKIGERRVNFHIKGLEALGAKCKIEQGYVHAKATQLRGADICLDIPSVGATENIMLAAVLAQGTTRIQNAAQEPEIVDLATFLNNMGARIRGAGTDVIRIEGVDELRATNTHTIIPDRIEAGTYLAFAAANGNGVLVKNVITEHLDPFIAKLQEMGVRLEIHEDSIYVPGGDLLVPVTVKTAPFPGFATDLQQPLTPLLLKAQGSSRIIDTLYPERVKHIPEMRKMGAKISSKDGIITVKRSKDLLGTTVEASEIRAGVSLLGLALMAEGTTVITKADNILRGYDRIVDKLKGLSVKVEIITDNRE